MKTLEERFWEKVDMRGEDECWPWKAAVDKDGYGRITLEYRSEQAPRLAFFLDHGYWPNVCRHSCDNPPCCNPKHLLDGTHADNSADKISRGRFKGAQPGERHHASKISDHQRDIVVALRGVWPQDLVGILFGLSQQGVSFIQRTWGKS